MKLKYMGDLPLISKNGVGFDHTEPDKYLYLHSALDLLEALSYGESETTNHLYKVEHHDISSSELIHELKKYIPNLEDVFVQYDKEAHDYVHDLVIRVRENEHLTEDERTAWLGNILIMRPYFYQYIINKSAYISALNALGDEIHTAKVKEIVVPMFKNYGMVLSDLSETLAQKKSPIDSELKVQEKDGHITGILTLSHY
jgi:hypothetical protein